jgi:hypothetical protein
VSHWCRISQVITRHIHEYLLLVASLSAYVNQAQLLLLSSLQNPSFVESNWRIGMLNQERLYICCSIAPDPRRQPNDSRRHYGALQFLPMLPPPWCDASEVPINCHPIYIYFHMLSTYSHINCHITLPQGWAAATSMSEMQRDTAALWSAMAPCPCNSWYFLVSRRMLIDW